MLTTFSLRYFRVSSRSSATLSALIVAFTQVRPTVVSVPIQVTVRPRNAFRNAKFFKTDLSGKCDSIHSEEKTGITQLITNPILWNGENQMTGDSIHLISNKQTEKLDSLKVLNNAFIISLDSISMEGFNQAKGKDLFGKFIENELKIIDLIKNTEVALLKHFKV